MLRQLLISVPLSCPHNSAESLGAQSLLIQDAIWKSSLISLFPH